MKKYLIYFLLFGCCALGFGFYQYYKPHQNMTKAAAIYQVPATDLFAEFENDEKAAEEKYLDKIVAISGTVSNVNHKKDGTQTITLESEHLLFGVLCELDPHSENPKREIKTGDQISLKGICTGMLSDVVLVRCVIL